jgi:hypothetical protein
MFSKNVPETDSLDLEVAGGAVIADTVGQTACAPEFMVTSTTFGVGRTAKGSTSGSCWN